MRIRGIAIVVLRLAAVGPCLAEMAPPPPTQSGFEIDRSASRLPSFIDLSPSISRETQVPLGTILTDAITTMTPQGIKSGLERTPSVWGFPVPELSPELARSSAPSVAAALGRGYAPRDVEFDSRFENNVHRIRSQLSLDQLVKPSSTISGTASSTISGPIIAWLDFQLDRSATVDEELSNGRIWGGAAVPPNQDPFGEAVALVGDSRVCSGTLVGPDLVLTAAHCYCRGVTDEALIGTSVITPLKRIKVLRDQSEAFRSCDAISKDLSIGDVAVLKLAEPAGVAARAIAPVSMIRGAAAIRAVGFGRTDGASPGFKYQVNVVIASYQCDGISSLGIPDEQVYRCKAAHELVAAGLNRDTCGGDSGGGVYIFGPDNQPYLAGVTSRAVDPKGKCGPGGIYSILSAPPLRSWLESKGLSFN